MAGSGNPYLDIIQGGATAPSADNPVNTALNSTNKYLNIIRGSGDQGAIAQGQSIAQNQGHHGGSWLGSLVKALDLPRAAVVSGLDTALHGGGFDQWLKGTENHETAGHLLNSLGIHNHVVDSIAGIAGDVALDPLTYLGGLGEIGKAAAVTGHVVDAVNRGEDAARAAEALKGSEAALRTAQGAGGADTALAASHSVQAATAAQKAAEAAQATGNGTLTADTLTRLQTKGLGGLNPAERQFLQEAHPELGSLHAGIGLKLPGAPRIPLAHTDAISGALHGMTSRIADTQAVRGLAEKFVPQGALKNSIRTAALSGDGVRVAALKGVERTLPEAAGVARQALNQYGKKLSDNVNDIPSENLRLLPAALEGDARAQAVLGDKWVPVQNTLAEMHDEASKMGVPLGKVENYFPHQLTEDARNLFASKGKAQARQAFQGELTRTYKPGTTFLGTQLETGSIDELNRISHEVYGKDAVDLFNANPREVLNNYVHGLSYRMGQQHLANSLDKQGISLTGDAAYTPEDWAKLGETGANGGRTAPQYVKDALTKIAEERTQGNKASPALLAWYDKALNVWKQYALAMPGKALRHIVATPGWGMYLAGVDTKHMGEAFSAWRAFQRGGIKAVDPSMRSDVQSFLDQGLSHGHEFHPQDLTGPKTRTAKINKVNPLSTKHGYFRANQDFQRAAQDYSRFAMFHDSVRKGYLAPEAAGKVRQFLGDPHNITSFERSTARRVVPFYCVPTDHEALTKRGWRRYDELILGEDVMVLDPVTHEMRWEPLLEVATFDFDGELRRMERNGQEFLFTDNHRWAVESNRSYVKGKWYGGDRKVVEAHELNGNHRIPLVGEFVTDEDSILSPRHAAILGWIVSDGYARWRGNHWEALVYQSPNKFLDDIVTLLGTTPRKPHPTTGVVPIPVSHADREVLKKHYHDKADLPDLVCKLSRPAAEAMWQAMFDAEGSTSPRGQRHFAQVDGPVLEAFQILSLMTGRSAWISGRGAYVRKGRFVNAVDKGRDGTVLYTGTVWCPRTPTGTWIMRHGGAAIPTGNTFLRQNLPTELKSVATKPQKFVNAYESPKQELEQFSPAQGIVPQYFNDTMSIRLPMQIGGNRTYLSPDLPFTRIGSLFSGRNQLESQTSPLIQDAIAYFNNANTFTGNQFSPYSKQVPGAWSKIPGLLEVLHAIAPNDVLRTSKASTDYGTTTAKGAWEISPKAESLIESLIPPLSQARRAYTTEPNMKGRGDTNLLADLLGQNFRTNDQYQQAAELYRRQAALKALIEQLQNQGQLPRYISGFHP